MSNDPIRWMRQQTTILQMQRQANVAARRNSTGWAMAAVLLWVVVGR